MPTKMTKKLYRVSVKVPDKKPVMIWVNDPENKEELKGMFQWNYGYWPYDIEVVEIVDVVEGA